MVNLNIRVKQFALPESGAQAQLNHPGLGEKSRSETKPVPNRRSQSPLRIRSNGLVQLKALGKEISNEKSNFNSMRSNNLGT